MEALSCISLDNSSLMAIRDIAPSSADGMSSNAQVVYAFSIGSRIGSPIGAGAISGLHPTQSPCHSIIVVKAPGLPQIHNDSLDS